MLLAAPLAQAVPVHDWSRGFAIHSRAHVAAVATDALGNVAVVGEFEGTIDRFGSFDWDHGNAIRLDAAGNVVVASRFRREVDFGGGPLGNATGEEAIVVAKYDGAGNHVWSRSFGDSNNASDCWIDLDGSGSTVLLSSSTGVMDFGGGPLQSAGGLDIFVAKLDADGDHVWSRRFGDSREQIASAVDVDGSGNVFLAVSFAGTVDLGGGPLTAASFSEIFVASLDADGNHRWSHHHGGGGHFVSSAATDGAGNLALAGTFQGTVDFGGGPLTSVGAFGNSDIYLASFDTDGNHRWSRRFVGEFENYAQSVATGGAGIIALTGELYGTVDFGGGDLGLTSGGSIFVARFQDSAVPVRFARFEASAQPGFVELQWDVFSDDAQERFTLYRGEGLRSPAVAVVEGLLRGTEPTYVDTGVEAGKTYSYQLAIQPRVGAPVLSEVATATVPAVRAHLAQNSPNPFNPRTSIAYTLSARSAAVLGIYDAAGKLVARLDYGVRNAGMHRAEWDGRDGGGKALASGVYYYRLEGVSGVGSRKMLLLR